jgi:quinol monooxygenase YgiN
MDSKLTAVTATGANVSHRLECEWRASSAPFLEGPLLPLIETLRASPGCISYQVTCVAQNPDKWLINGQWQSSSQMVQHFSDNALQSLFRWLQATRVYRVQLDCDT